MPLLMHRTRNRGVIGVNGWHTQGPAVSGAAIPAAYRMVATPSEVRVVGGGTVTFEVACFEGQEPTGAEQISVSTGNAAVATASAPPLTGPNGKVTVTVTGVGAGQTQVVVVNPPSGAKTHVTVTV